MTFTDGPEIKIFDGGGSKKKEILQIHELGEHHSQPENFKKSRPKKLLKSNGKSISRNCDSCGQTFEMLNGNVVKTANEELGTNHLLHWRQISVKT